MPDDEDRGSNESDESDKKSKMSFSYCGADNITVLQCVQQPALKILHLPLFASVSTSGGGTTHLLPWFSPISTPGKDPSSTLAPLDFGTRKRVRPSVGEPPLRACRS